MWQWLGDHTRNPALKMLPQSLVAAAFLLVGTGAMNKFTNCPPVLIDTSSVPVFIFSTDPGVTYASFCHKYTGNDCANENVANVDGTPKDPKFYDSTYVKLPFLSVTDYATGTPVANGYYWTMTSDPVSSIDNGAVIAVPNTLVETCAQIPDATARTHTGTGGAALTASDCITADYTFDLAGASEPMRNWQFTAYTDDGSSTEACAGSPNGEPNYLTCCQIGVRVVDDEDPALQYMPLGPNQYIKRCKDYSDACVCAVENIGSTPSTDRECVPWTQCSECQYEMQGAALPSLSQNRDCRTMLPCSPVTQLQTASPQVGAEGCSSGKQVTTSGPTCQAFTVCNAYTDATSPEYEYRGPGTCSIEDSAGVCTTQAVGAKVPHPCGDYYSADRECKCVTVCTCALSSNFQCLTNETVTSEVNADSGLTVMTDSRRCQCLDSRSSAADKAAVSDRVGVKVQGQYESETCTYLCVECDICASAEVEEAPCMRANDPALEAEYLSVNNMSTIDTSDDLAYCSNTKRYSVLPTLASPDGVTYTVTAYGQCGLLSTGRVSCFFGCDESTRCAPASICGCTEYVTAEPTPTTDRQCSTKAAFEISQLALMNAGASYVNIAVGSGDNIAIVPATVCSACQYESTPGSVQNDADTCSTPLFVTDRVCTPLTRCLADEWEIQAPTASSDRICGPVTACASYSEAEWPDAQGYSKASSLTAGLNTTAMFYTDVSGQCIEAQVYLPTEAAIAAAASIDDVGTKRTQAQVVSGLSLCSCKLSCGANAQVASPGSEFVDQVCECSQGFYTSWTQTYEQNATQGYSACEYTCQPCTTCGWVEPSSHSRWDTGATEYYAQSCQGGQTTWPGDRSNDGIDAVCASMTPSCLLQERDFTVTRLKEQYGSDPWDVASWAVDFEGYASPVDIRRTETEPNDAVLRDPAQFNYTGYYLYEAVAPTSTSDRVCAPRELCGLTEYEVTTENVTTALPRVCLPLTNCSSAHFLNATTRTHPFVGLLNDTATFVTASTSTVLYVADTTCAELTVCKCTQYQSSAPAASSDDGVLIGDRTCTDMQVCTSTQHESFMPTVAELLLPASHSMAVLDEYGESIPTSLYLSDRQCSGFTDGTCNSNQYFNDATVECVLDPVMVPTDAKLSTEAYCFPADGVPPPDSKASCIGKGYATVDAANSSGFDFLGDGDALKAIDNWYPEERVRVTLSYPKDDTDSSLVLTDNACKDEPADFMDTLDHDCSWYAQNTCSVGFTGNTAPITSVSDKTRRSLTPALACCACGGGSATPVPASARFAVSGDAFSKDASSIRSVLASLDRSAPKYVYQELLVTTFAKPADHMTMSGYPRSYLPTAEWAAAGCCTDDSLNCPEAAMAVTPCVSGANDFAIRGTTDPNPGFHATAAVYTQPSEDWCQAQKVDTCSFKVYVYDEEKPYMACPADTHVCTDGGATSDSMYATMFTNATHHHLSRPWVHTDTTAFGVYNRAHSADFQSFFPDVDDNVDGHTTDFPHSILDCEKTGADGCESTLTVSHGAGFQPRSKTGNVVSWETDGGCTVLETPPTVAEKCSATKDTDLDLDGSQFGSRSADSQCDWNMATGACTVGVDPIYSAYSTDGMAWTAPTGAGKKMSDLCEAITLNPTTTSESVKYDECMKLKVFDVTLELWVTPCYYQPAVVAASFGSDYTTYGRTCDVTTTGGVTTAYVSNDGISTGRQISTVMYSSSTATLRPTAAGGVKGAVFVGQSSESGIGRTITSVGTGNAGYLQPATYQPAGFNPIYTTALHTPLGGRKFPAQAATCTQECPNYVLGLQPPNFIIGEHTIAWTATDSYKNTRSCSSKLIVHDCACPTFQNCSMAEVDVKTTATAPGQCYGLFDDLGATVTATDNSEVAPKLKMYVVSGVHKQVVDDDYRFPIGDTIVSVMAWDMSANLEGAYAGNTYAGKVGSPDSYPRIRGMACTADDSASSGCADRTLSSGLSTVYPLEGTTDSPCTCTFTVRVVDEEDPVITCHFDAPVGNMGTVTAVTTELLSSASMTYATITNGLTIPALVMVPSESSPCPGGFCVYDNSGCEGTVRYMTGSPAAPVDESTRFFVGGASTVTAEYTDCANNTATCPFNVAVPGTWAKLASFEQPVCMCNCSGNAFEQTCSEGVSSTGLLSTPNAYVSVAAAPLDLLATGPQQIGYSTHWSPTATTNGASSNDNLGNFIGDTEDYDCDTVGVQPYLSSANSLLGHSKLLGHFFTMEDPDGTYWVELDTIAIAQNSNAKYVYAHYGGVCAACTVFFKHTWTTAAGIATTVYTNYTQSSAPAIPSTLDTTTLNMVVHQLLIPSDTALVDVSFGLESNDHTSEAYFDVVAVGEDGCMEPTNAHYASNAVFQSVAGLCDSAPCCNEPLAPGFMPGVQCLNHDIAQCNFEATDVVLANMGTRIDAVQTKMAGIEATAQNLLELIRS